MTLKQDVIPKFFSLLLLIILAWFNDLGILSGDLLTLPLQTTVLCFVAVVGYAFFTSFRVPEDTQPNGSNFGSTLVSGGGSVTFFVVSATLALLGFFFISAEISYLETGGQAVEFKSSSKTILGFYVEGQSIELMVVALLVSFLLVIFSGRNAFERRLKNKIFQRQRIAKILKSTGRASVSQVFHLAIYVVIGLSFFDDLPVLSLIAATAIVGFCASLPFSLYGWGVRELASVAVFGALGSPATESLAYAIAIGLIYTCGVLFADKIVARYGKNGSQTPQENDPQANQSRPQSCVEKTDLHRSVALSCGLLCAVFVFFQPYISALGTTATINLGDPIALLGLAFVGIQFFAFKQLPFYLTSHVWIWLGSCALALFIGLIVGISEFGITPWAMINRGFGFFIILGYFACGAMMSGQFGQHGIRRLVEVFTLTLFVVSIATIFYKWAYDPPVYYWTYRGFSANRNALAFQILTVFVLFSIFLLPPLCKNRKISKNKIFSILIGVFCMYIASYISSRTLDIVIVSLLFFYFIFFRKKLRNLICFIFLIFFLFFEPSSKIYFQKIPTYVEKIQLISTAESSEVKEGESNSGKKYDPDYLYSKFDNIYKLNPYKDMIRIQILIDGLNLFLSNPILGTGIGAYIKMKGLVFHSTWLWILAEMGLVGAFLVGASPLYALGAVWSAFRSKAKHRIGGLNARQSGIVLVLFVFVLFGIMHDLAYQRIFWLILGALLAQTQRSKAPIA